MCHGRTLVLLWQENTLANLTSFLIHVHLIKAVRKMYLYVCAYYHSCVRYILGKQSIFTKHYHLTLSSK